MAKLSAHGAEVARWETTDDTDVPGDHSVRQYSLRSDAYILVKTKIARGWSAWRVYGNYGRAAVPAIRDYVRVFRRLLDRKHGHVEEVR